MDRSYYMLKGYKDNTVKILVKSAYKFNAILLKVPKGFSCNLTSRY